MSRGSSLACLPSGASSQWCDRIRQASVDDEPASWVVSETIRLSQSEFVLRETQCPVTVEGYTIPAGWWLRVLVREATATPMFSRILSDLTVPVRARDATSVRIFPVRPRRARLHR